MPKVSRRRFVCLLGAATGTAGLLSTDSWRTARTTSEPLARAQRTSWALGANASLTVLARTARQAELAIDAAFRELEQVESLMSLYRPTSQLCQLNRDGVLTEPHPHLVAVLRAARHFSERTEGAFDVTVQPLWTTYETARALGRLPSEAEIDAARTKVHWRSIAVDEHQIRLGKPGMAVTLNGIAQGFAADRVASVLRDHGVEHALIDTGELSTLGAKPEGTGWRVGIQHPRQSDAFLSLVRLAGRCLATSGDYATSFSADYRHHHLFDPHTGRSPTDLASVSIAASTALEADALSTAVFVLGPTRGLKLVQETANADALLVLKNGGTLATSGFPSGA